MTETESFIRERNRDYPLHAMCWASPVVAIFDEKDASIAALTAEVARLKKLMASLPAAISSVGKPGLGGLEICGNIPSEIYVAIGRDRYHDEYEVAEATAEAVKENTARYVEHLIKDNPNAQ